MGSGVCVSVCVCVCMCGVCVVWVCGREIPCYSKAIVSLRLRECRRLGTCCHIAGFAGSRDFCFCHHAS